MKTKEQLQQRLEIIKSIDNELHEADYYGNTQPMMMNDSPLGWYSEEERKDVKYAIRIEKRILEEILNENDADYTTKNYIDRKAIYDKLEEIILKV